MVCFFNPCWFGVVHVIERARTRIDFNHQFCCFLCQADPKGTGSIGALDAATFLKKSKLSDIVLSQVSTLLLKTPCFRTRHGHYPTVCRQYNLTSLLYISNNQTLSNDVVLKLWGCKMPFCRMLVCLSRQLDCSSCYLICLELKYIKWWWMQRRVVSRIMQNIEANFSAFTLLSWVCTCNWPGNLKLSCMKKDMRVQILHRTWENLGEFYLIGPCAEIQAILKD